MSQLYELNLEKIQKILSTRKYKRILIQMPEGMLDQPLQSVIDKIKTFDKDLDVFVSGAPSYGICDLAIDLAKKLRCQLLVHYGHTLYGFEKRIEDEMSKQGLEVLVVPAFVNRNITVFLDGLVNEIKNKSWNKVSLVSTAQHLNRLVEVKKYLEKNEIKVVQKGGGQIIGCNVNSIRTPTEKNIDGVVTLNAGIFHIKGMLLNVNKPIIQLNPYDGTIQHYSESDRKKLIQKRYAVINKAKKALTWGIIGSIKIGQYNSNQINSAIKILDKNSRKFVTVVSEKIDFTTLSNLNWVDAWVNTSCPRLALDDQIRLMVPILTYKEFLCVFDKVSWDDLLLHGFF